jgi:cell wall assembly regulator SMI1
MRQLVASFLNFRRIAESRVHKFSVIIGFSFSWKSQSNGVVMNVRGDIVSIYFDLGELLGISEFSTQCTGALPESISKLKELADRIPEDVIKLYEVSDGEPFLPGVEFLSIFYSYEFLPIKSLIKQVEIWRGVQHDSEQGPAWLRPKTQSVPVDAVELTVYSRGWLPFAHDGGGNHFAIDCSPGSSGVFGQIINFGRDEEVNFQWAPSLTGFLDRMRDDYRARRRHFRFNDQVDLYHERLKGHRSSRHTL